LNKDSLCNFEHSLESLLLAGSGFGTPQDCQRVWRNGRGPWSLADNTGFAVSTLVPKFGLNSSGDFSYWGGHGSGPGRET